VFRALTHIKSLVSSCFYLFQRCLLRWTKPSHTSLVLGTVMDLAREKSELIAENALLRQQLVILRRQIKRPRYTKTDRLLLVLLARAVRPWRQALLIVQPETLLKWHRQGFPLFLEAEVKGEVRTSESGSPDHRVNQGDGKQQSTLGSGAHPGRVAQAGYSRVQTNDSEVHASCAYASSKGVKMGDVPAQSCRRNLGL